MTVQTARVPSGDLAAIDARDLRPGWRVLHRGRVREVQAVSRHERGGVMVAFPAVHSFGERSEPACEVWFGRFAVVQARPPLTLAAVRDELRDTVHRSGLLHEGDAA